MIKNKNLNKIIDKLKEFKLKELTEFKLKELDDVIESKHISTLTCSLRNVINYDCFVTKPPKYKLKEISQAIHIDESSIIKLMKHESGLNPMAKNSIGCVGLIQFCPGGGSTKTVNGKSYSLEDLRNNLEVQMDAIKDFWVKGYNNGKIRKPADLYIYNFFPVAAGKSDDFVLQSKGLSANTVAKANPIFNKTLGKSISSPLTVGDLKHYYQKTGMV